MHSVFTVPTILIPLLFGLLFLVTGGFALVKAAQSLYQRQHTLPSPIRTTTASVLSKRAAVLQNWRSLSGAPLYPPSSMIYYVTFQLKDGNQLEFPVQKADYALLTKGAVGQLTVQGSQYLFFEPRRAPTESFH